MSFGGEQVMHAKKAYVSFYAIPLLIKALFNVVFSLIPHEIIISQTKRVILLHIFSSERLNQILQLAGECPSSI